MFNMRQQSLTSDDLISTSCSKKNADDYNNALPWYHGMISKQRTDKLLRANEDGLFLVKDSPIYPGDFSLCVKFKNELHEYRIKRYHTCKLTLDDEEYFDTLEDLIEKYRDSKKEICVSLFHYVLKECKEFGRIFIATYNNRKVMLKAVKRVDAVEGMLRRSVCHENLMNVIGLTRFDRTSYLVSSYLRYGTLLDLLRIWSRTTYVRKFAYNFSYDICSGMEYLEKKCVVHKYLAARNVWISRNGIAKLSNFGLNEEYVSSHRHLPYRHWAPEVLIAKKHSQAGDMWSFGVTLWEMFTNGAIPYADYAHYRILKLLRTGQRLPKPRSCPGDMFETMKYCWQWRASDRPKFSEMRKKFNKLRIELYHPEFLLEF